MDGGPDAVERAQAHHNLGHQPEPVTCRFHKPGLAWTRAAAAVAAPARAPSRWAAAGAREVGARAAGGTRRAVGAGRCPDATCGGETLAADSIPGVDAQALRDDEGVGELQARGWRGRKLGGQKVDDGAGVDAVADDEELVDVDQGKEVGGRAVRVGGVPHRGGLLREEEEARERARRDGAVGERERGRQRAELPNAVQGDDARLKVGRQDERKLVAAAVVVEVKVGHAHVGEEVVLEPFGQKGRLVLEDRHDDEAIADGGGARRRL